jgi:AAA15 family ATPase/GTPase
MKVSLFEFSVENFKIFKERATFSLFARKSKSVNTFPINGDNLLKTSLIFGPNASGKSSLLDAFSIIRAGIINSANNPEGSILPYQPFIFRDIENQPTFFEIIFAIDKKVFRYNFSFLNNKIITENLYEIISSEKEKIFFQREEQNISVKLDFEKSKDVAEVHTRKEVLFLSAASQWNNSLAIDIVNAIKNINKINSTESEFNRAYTMSFFDDNIKKSKIINFLQQADFNIQDGVKEKISIPKTISEQFPTTPKEVNTIYFSHKKFDSKGNESGIINLNIGDESKGTQKFFDLLGPIVDTLENGKVLFIDELDNSLHPLITKFIVDLFENHNPNNAQMIATTHDTNLLSNSLNKQQIWFTEKDKLGSAKIFSLAEFIDIRNDIEFTKKYLEGRFGALPFIEFGD